MIHYFSMPLKISLALTILAGLSITPSTAQETVLHAFKSGEDGSTPLAGLIADQKGNLYSTTEQGGGGTGCDNGSLGCGTVFEITRNGRQRVLHRFEGGDDGALPLGGLLLDASGNLYGTTEGEGSYDCANASCGTVFKLAPDGTETLLYAFQSWSDGIIPASSLVADGVGNLYGTTEEGGNTAQCNTNGCGTVFEISAAGTKTTLYTFCSQANCADGAYPSGLVMDASGNLYGAAAEGGSAGWGAIFKITPGGAETVLYSFQYGDDGAFPRGPLLLDASGDLYGATQAGGSNGDYGTVFRLAPDGTLTALYGFGQGPDGGQPNGGLVMDKKGNLYGTARYGGTGDCRSGCGVVFEVTPAGKEKAIHSFDKTDGSLPYAGLLLGKHGELYGTTTQGGDIHTSKCIVKKMQKGCGVVFEVSK